MIQSSCKRDTKSESHPGIKLALVRLFSCKHPVDVQRRQRNVQKKRDLRPENLMLFCQSKPNTFLPLSLPLPSLKLPNDWCLLQELTVAIKGS